MSVVLNNSVDKAPLMTRDKRIAVSQEELQAVEDARVELFGDSDAPNGLVVREVCRRYIHE